MIVVEIVSSDAHFAISSRSLALLTWRLTERALHLRIAEIATWTRTHASTVYQCATHTGCAVSLRYALFAGILTALTSRSHNKSVIRARYNTGH